MSEVHIVQLVFQTSSGETASACRTAHTEAKDAKKSEREHIGVIEMLAQSLVSVPGPDGHQRRIPLQQIFSELGIVAVNTRVLTVKTQGSLVVPDKKIILAS